jgi:hypothetical protein
MEGMAGRKRVLTPDLVEELAANLAAHATVEEACSASGLSPRSVRRWRAEGERELAELSPQARLALELQRVAEERRSTDWRQAASQLEALDPRWSLDALLAGFGANRLGR